MLRKVLALVLVLIVAGAAIGFYIWFKPHRSADGEKPVATLTAEQLYMEYSTNTPDCDAKYLNKVLEISGTVNTVSTNDQNETKIALATSDMLAEIAFIMKPGEKTADVKPGTNIVLKGICTGYDMDVQFKQSVLSGK